MEAGFVLTPMQHGLSYVWMTLLQGRILGYLDIAISKGDATSANQLAIDLVHLSECIRFLNNAPVGVELRAEVA